MRSTDGSRPERCGSEVTAQRPISLTNLPDGRAILEVGDSRIDFSEREFEVLTLMLLPNVPQAPAPEWRD